MFLRSLIIHELRIVKIAKRCVLCSFGPIKCSLQVRTYSNNKHFKCCNGSQCKIQEEAVLFSFTQLVDIRVDQQHRLPVSNWCEISYVRQPPPFELEATKPLPFLAIVLLLFAASNRCSFTQNRHFINCLITTTRSWTLWDWSQSLMQITCLWWWVSLKLDWWDWSYAACVRFLTIFTLEAWWSTNGAYPNLCGDA